MGEGRGQGVEGGNLKNMRFSSDEMALVHVDFGRTHTQHRGPTTQLRYSEPFHLK